MRKAVVVGAIGRRRKILKDVLESKGSKVICFVDNICSEREYDGVPIIRDFEIEEYLGDFDGDVYLTFPTIDDRRRGFAEGVLSRFKGNIRVYNYRETYSFHKEALFLARELGDYWLSKNYDRERAYGVIEMFSDEKSKVLVSNWIAFRETLDLSLIPDPEGDQYLPRDVPLIDSIPDRYSLLDLGAYDGDSLVFILSKLEGLGKAMDLYIAFEPDSRNFNKLRERVRELIDRKVQNTKFLLLKAGCSDEYRVLALHSDWEGSRLLDGERDARVDEWAYTMVADDVLNNVRVDLIKIDTEGFEMRCLRGLRKSIWKSRPIIAVSLYHRPEDIYEIPEFLQQLCRDYSFYLRVHSTFFMGTVLYAVPKLR